MHFQGMDTGFTGLCSPSLELTDAFQIIPFLPFFLWMSGNPQHHLIYLLGQNSLGNICELNQSYIKLNRKYTNLPPYCSLDVA